MAVDTADGLAGTTVDYLYRITNSAGGGEDTFNITAVSSNGWQIELYDATGTTLLATDTNGDGTWESLTGSAIDADSNGEPDTGDSPKLKGGPDYEFLDYVFRITIPPGATVGTTDTLTVTGETFKQATDSTIPGSPLAPVTDTADSVTTVVAPNAPPLFTVLKFVQVDDGNANASDDFYVPGAEILYRVIITNSGTGSPDEDSFVFTDDLPDEVTLFVGDYVGGGGGPVDFSNGIVSSSLNYSFGGLSDTNDSIVFKDSGGSPIIPNAVANGGYDDAVRSFEITADGTFAPSSGSPPNPSIEIEYRVRLK